MRRDQYTLVWSLNVKCYHPRMYTIVKYEPYNLSI